MTKTVTITLELNEDASSTLTWGEFRKLIEYRTPLADNLRVSEGLSAPINQDTAWGKYALTVEGPALGGTGI